MFVLFALLFIIFTSFLGTLAWILLCEILTLLVWIKLFKFDRSLSERELVQLLQTEVSSEFKYSTACLKNSYSSIVFIGLTVLSQMSFISLYKFLK